MKNFIRLFGAFIVITILFVAGINVYTKDSKTRETRQAVSESMEKTVSDLTMEDLKTANESEMADYFVTRITTDVSSIDKAINVDIYDINYEEGFIDAEVKAYFNYVFGNSSVTVRKTLYVDDVGVNDIIQDDKTKDGTDDGNGSLMDGKTGTASSFVGENTLNKINDNDINTFWESKNNTVIDGDDVINEQDIIIDLEKIYSVNRMRIQWMDIYSIKYDIEVSTDKKTWTKVKSVKKGDGNSDSIQFDTSLCRYIKLSFHTISAENKGYKIGEVSLFSSYNTKVEFTKDNI